MDKKVIILSGMPASGKDTITDRLCQIDSRFVSFKKYRSVGPYDKKKPSYYNICEDEFNQKILEGEFIQYHRRYGRYYGISEHELYDNLQNGKIPVIHIGRIENFETFMHNVGRFREKYSIDVDFIHFLLWEDEEELEKRIYNREKTDEECAKRISAMRQEFDDNIEMMDKGIRPFSAIIKNVDVDKTCKYIINYIQDGAKDADDGYETFWTYLEFLKKKRIQ